MSSHTITSKKHGLFIVIVDDVDDDLFVKHMYHIGRRSDANAFYAKRNKQLGIQNGKRKSTTVFLHTEIGLRLGFVGLIDHKNRNTLDNQRKNLRVATPLENSRNRGIRKDNKTGTTGVYFCKPLAYRINPWRAYVKIDKKLINLGFFPTKEKAIEARSAAILLHYGDFVPQKES